MFYPNRKEPVYNPFYGQVSEKIGITNYIISVSCEGKEAIQEKIKRLIFDAPQREKEEDCA